jgi:hypothetical protein
MPNTEKVLLLITALTTATLNDNTVGGIIKKFERVGHNGPESTHECPWAAAASWIHQNT